MALVASQIGVRRRSKTEGHFRDPYPAVRLRYFDTQAGPSVGELHRGGAELHCPVVSEPELRPTIPDLEDPPADVVLNLRRKDHVGDDAGVGRIPREPKVADGVLDPAAVLAHLE